MTDSQQPSKQPESRDGEESHSSSPSTHAESQPAKQRKPPRRPVAFALFTLLVFCGYSAAYYWNSALEDAFGLPLDVLNVYAMFSYVGFTLMWVLWIAFFSRWDKLTRLMSIAAIFLVPLTAFRVLNPVFGGDLTIVGFRPIWEAAPVIPRAGEEALDDVADLKPESESDFPQFLGPNRNGVIQSGLRFDFPALSEDSIVWTIPVGPAWSGFVARNGFAVTMEQRQDKECVTCYRIRDGKLIWIYRHDARHEDSFKLGQVGPRSTPAIHNGMVYSIGAIGNLVCLNGADGTVVWQVDLNELLGLELKDTTGGEYPAQGEANSTLEWGRSGSVLIHEDLVIVPGGGPIGGPHTTLFAFDLLTGEVRWKGGNEMIGYGSPTLQTVSGVSQILMMAESKGMSFDPASGKVLWTWDRPGVSSGMANTSQMFAVADDQVLMSKGYPDGGGTLIKVIPSDDGWQTERIWESPRVLKTKLTSPVIRDGHTYSICNGFLECARLSDGKRIWKHRGRLGHGQLLLVNDQLVVQSEFGELIVAPATPEGYREIVKINSVEGTCWNTLCLTGDKLLVRSAQQAACIQLPHENEANRDAAAL